MDLRIPKGFRLGIRDRLVLPLMQISGVAAVVVAGPVVVAGLLRVNVLPVLILQDYHYWIDYSSVAFSGGAIHA